MNCDLWEGCKNFHGHECPGLAIGYKVSEAVTDLFNIPLERAQDEELVCVSENDSCSVDCIQHLLSCTVGKGNLLFRPTGKSVYTFFNRGTRDAVRISVKPFDKSKLSREELIQHILSSSKDDLFIISKPKIELPEKARLFQSITCSTCGESVREDKIRLQDGKTVCLDCFESYERCFL